MYSKLALLIVFFIVLISQEGCTLKKPTIHKKFYKTKLYEKYKKVRGALRPSKVKNSEAINRATMRPYTVRGKKYYPKVPKLGDTFNGIASWYGYDFHAERTANGEKYNMYDKTAAHKTLPMNTLVNVHNKDNGKSVVVRINDRGPFVEGRVLDMTLVAARQLGIEKSGIANVKLTVVGVYGKNYNEVNNDNINSQNNSTYNNIDTQNNTIYNNINSYPVEGKYLLQVGAFRNINTAQNEKMRLESDLIVSRSTLVIRQINGLYKLYISGFNTKEEANSYKDRYGLYKSFVVKQ